MKISISFEIAKVQYRAAINSFVYQLGADGTKLLKEEMRLLLRDIMRFTPPKTRKQGEDAISGDLYRAAFPLRPEKIKWKRMKELVLSRDINAIRELWMKQRKGFFAYRRLLLSVAEIKENHKRHRTRYGRVSSDKNRMAFADHWDTYTKTVQSFVGFARAGWSAAANAVGLKLPKWVSRHSGKAGSGYRPPRPDRLEIEAINRSSKIPNYEFNVVSAATKMRAVSMQRELQRIVAGGKSRRGSLAATIHGQPAD